MKRKHTHIKLYLIIAILFLRLVEIEKWMIKLPVFKKTVLGLCCDGFRYRLRELWK